MNRGTQNVVLADKAAAIMFGCFAVTGLVSGSILVGGKLSKLIPECSWSAMVLVHRLARLSHLRRRSVVH